MNSLIFKYLENIVNEDGHNMSFGSLKTIADIKKEVENMNAEIETLKNAIMILKSKYDLLGVDYSKGDDRTEKYNYKPTAGT